VGLACKANTVLSGLGAQVPDKRSNAPWRDVTGLRQVDGMPKDQLLGDGLLGGLLVLVHGEGVRSVRKKDGLIAILEAAGHQS